MEQEVEGYPRLAEYMASAPQNLIFRQFKALNTQILLYKQAEITHLERKLKEVQHRDANSSDKKNKYSRDWRELCKSEIDDDDEDEDTGLGEQLDLINQIKPLIRDYNDLMLQVAAVSRLEKPNPKDLLYLRRWFWRPLMGNYPLMGPDRFSWGDTANPPSSRDPDSRLQDLVALCGRGEEAHITRFISDICVPMVHQLFRWRPDEITIHSEVKMQRCSSIIATILSSLLPVLSIIVLYQINSMGIRLGLVAVFTVIFSLSLAIVTGARSVDIFASTTAFAAVQVVFVGTTGGQTC